MSQEVLLSVRDVSKRFGGLQALGGFSVDVRRGEIVGLIGPNGAGKTTLFNVIAGVCRPDGGSVVYKGQEISSLRPFERCRLGIARTFQTTHPFVRMTVLENVAVGAHFGRNGGGDLTSARKKASEILDFVGLSHRKDDLAKGLTIGERKMLEVCRALAAGPELLLLDEVVAGLHAGEVLQMMEVIRKVAASGVTVVMIEHVMRAVMGVSGRLVVLHYGKKLAEGTPEQVAANPDVITAYLGGMAHHA
jgi:branched-chain amino acid transport system ATP-binding protein